MKVRITIPGTVLGTRLTALCWGALTLVALVTVSACSGSSTSSPGVPTFSPSVTISPTVTSTVTAPATTPGVTSDAAATHTATAIATATATATVTVTAPPVSPVPTVAPVTGGGGTAGPQDVILFGLGVAAILAGAGSLAYRRWLSRGR